MSRVTLSITHSEPNVPGFVALALKLVNTGHALSGIAPVVPFDVVVPL